MRRTAAPAVLDVVLPGHLAELLADTGGRGLAEALDLIVSELDLRSAVLRDGPSGGPQRLRAVAGDPGQVVPTMRLVPGGDGTSLELPLLAGGRTLGVLTVVGARPSQLPVLRAAAAVLALALSRPAPTTSELADQLVAAADAEADEAADRLHDGAVQALVAARYAADAAVRGGDPAAARDAVQTALVELRRALWHQRPRGDEHGLIAALELLSARLVEAGGSPLGLVVDESVAAALPGSAASVAYRLVQAVALPDGATAVRVSVHRDPSGAVVEIDGGADLTSADRWIGKARMLGGSLTITAGHLRLVVPLTGTKANP
jgi:signal transduction histidine kinase